MPATVMIIKLHPLNQRSIILQVEINLRVVSVDSHKRHTVRVNIFIRWRARVAWHIVNVEALKSNCLAPLTHTHTRVWPTIWLEFSHKYATRRGQLARRWLLLPENISTRSSSIINICHGVTFNYERCAPSINWQVVSVTWFELLINR